MTLPKQYHDLAKTLATELNYSGKRSDNGRNSVCEEVNRQLMEEYPAFKGVDNASYRALFDQMAEEQKAAKAAAKKKADTRPVESGRLELESTEWPTFREKRFIITSAQNNTPVHANFLKSLENYAAYIGAKLLISTYTYNKSGFQNGDAQEGLYYAPEVRQYLQESAVYLGNEQKIAFLAHINILPTADYPLTGFEESLGQHDAIIGHAKITSQAVAALKGDTVRRMYSTGTVTQRNYIQQKAGQKASVLHNYGALIVEINNNGDHFVRQIETMDNSGVFYDLQVKASPEGCEIVADNVLAVNWGDIHAEKLDFDVARVSWAHQESILHTLRPTYQFIHDVLDFTARNHHNIGSGFFLAEQFYSGKDSVKQDLKTCSSIIQYMAANNSEYGKRVIVESNHDLALTRWLDSTTYNPNTDPVNALSYYSLKSRMYKALAEKDSDFNMLRYALSDFIKDKKAMDDVIFLKTDDSFKMNGIEFGIHGHNGANGSRGTPKQFKKLGVKVNSGHTHTPSIFGGVYTAGVSGLLDMGYNQGASSWCHTHILTYVNGARTLIDIKNGEWSGR